MSIPKFYKILEDSEVPYWNSESMKEWFIRELKLDNSLFNINIKNNLIYKQYVITFKNDYIIVYPNVESSKGTSIYNNKTSIVRVANILKLI